MPESQLLQKFAFRVLITFILNTLARASNALNRCVSQRFELRQKFSIMIAGAEAVIKIVPERLMIFAVGYE